MGERADSTERGRPTVAQGQTLEEEVRISTRRTGAHRRSGRRVASPVEWRPATPTSVILPAAIWARHRTTVRRISATCD